jgi:uncharacterized membrane protein YqiK
MPVVAVAIAVVVAVIVLIIIFKMVWRVAEPNEALIISAPGPSRSTGSTAWASRS